MSLAVQAAFLTRKISSFERKMACVTFHLLWVQSFKPSVFCINNIMIANTKLAGPLWSVGGLTDLKGISLFVKEKIFSLFQRHLNKNVLIFFKSC